MTNKKLKEAESCMKPGYFQHAVGIYESLGMKEKAKEASLACAADCLGAMRYAYAIKYFKKAGKAEISSKVELICKSNGLNPSEEIEMRACMMGFCPDYVSSAIEVSKSDDMKSLVEKLKEKK